MRKKILLTICLMFITFLNTYAQTEVIKKISIEGVRIIEKSAVLNKLDTKINEVLDEDKISDDLKRIYKMGFFSDVYVEKVYGDEGLHLKFIVKEKPYIREIRFKGNKEFSEDDLKTQISTKRFSFMDEKKLKDDVEKIIKQYKEKGYYFVEVKYSIDTYKDRPGDIVVTFDINEGKKVRIDKIVFKGLNKFPASKLKKVMETKESWLFSWITGSGTYKEDVMKDDYERIKEFYSNEGYLEAKVINHNVYLNKKKDGLIVEIEVYEGEKYFVVDVGISGDAKEYEKELLPLLKLKKNEVYKVSNIRDDISFLVEYMGNKGYAYANTEPLFDVDEKNHTVRIDYHVTKGKLVQINRIIIEGNTKTRDNVIRRELNIIEGDLYNASSLKKSRIKLNRLGYFEDLNFVPQRIEYEKPESEDQDLMDVLIRVKERPTGFLTFGVGYSSVDQFMGSLQVSQNNLFGKGQKLSAKLQIGSKTQEYDVSFLEPWLFGKPVSGGIDIFKVKRKYTDYTKESTGFGLRSGYRISDDWSVTGGYRFEIADVTDVKVTASQIIKDQIGKRTTSSIYGNLIRDTRNDAFYPTDGSSFTFYLEFAGGPLGGDNDYVKSVVDYAKYFLLPWQHTISIHGQYGIVESYGSKKLPIYERFFLGGMYTLRGFESRSIGPKDPKTGDVLGGDRELFGNIEYIFPLIKEAGVRGVLFFDFGNAYNSNILPPELRYSVGAGIRWYSPMGPLRLEWGKNLNPKRDEKSSKWEFSIGTIF
ncbi:MAG: outer membrane protein assembly factor BamA [Proteobacteria bacterium]|nr:outer membrane protein assembly factor BamA [Pseudomonadota bacterium]